MLDVTRLRVLAAVARTGSVTAAAQQLGYAQPSISHHLARLEAETGARLVQRVGRGIRLTPTGQLLAERATEILGRIDAAEAELAEQVGLRAGRVRLAAFPSALGTFVPAAAAAFNAAYPGVQLQFVEAEPPEALEMLRAGAVEVAVIFEYRHPPTETTFGGLRRVPLLVEPVHLVTSGPAHLPLTDHREARWIGGCERCREHLIELCAAAGFTPRIAFTTDDYVAVQSLVVAELGIAVLPALALAAHRNPQVSSTELPGGQRLVHAALYGQPPDPPATAALLQQLVAEAVRWGAPAI